MFEMKQASGLAAGRTLIPQYTPESRSGRFEPFRQLRLRDLPAGAQDYLVKSLIRPKDIVRCIHMALSRQKRQAPGKERRSAVSGMVLGFIGSKGGVGTSAT